MHSFIRKIAHNVVVEKFTTNRAMGDVDFIRTDAFDDNRGKDVDGETAAIIGAFISTVIIISINFA